MTLNCGHRGASGHAPENTLGAIQLAAEMGAEMVEFDVQFSAEGHPVLIHDSTLKRTTNNRGRVKNKNLAELEKLDAGTWFDSKWSEERIPTLAETLKRFGSRLKFNIEIKGDSQVDREKRVVELVRSSGYADCCIITSFDHKCIDRIVESAPELKVGYITKAWRKHYLTDKVHVLSLRKTLVTEKRVLAAHEAGKEVHVWTVNEEEDMRRFLDLKVDAIITNYPDVLQRVRDSR